MQLEVPAELVQAFDEEQQQLMQQQMQLFSTQYETLQAVLQLQIQLHGDDPTTKQEDEEPATNPDTINAAQPPRAFVRIDWRAVHFNKHRRDRARTNGRC